MAEHYVIIGNGPAANTAATTLRELSRTVRITMIGSECRGYYRPDLLPRYVSGKIDAKAVYVHPFIHYGKLNINLRLGQEVAQIDFPHKKLTLDHKEIVRYDGLIIATGGVSHIPEPLRACKDLFLTLKTVNDANQWKDRLTHVSTVALAGGDVTSLALAKELLDFGKQVTFVLDDRCFWPFHSDVSSKANLIKWLEGRGAKVIDGKRINGVTQEGEFEFTLVAQSGKIRAGLVGAFFGLSPNVKFLDRSGIHIEKGIIVDETLRTSVTGVYAAGDCAQVYSPKIGDYWVSIGYGNAKNLGRVAAKNLLGSKVEAGTAENSIFDVEGISVSNTWWTEF
jgi:NAD(P)H-nitrite reductase large subunit